MATPNVAVSGSFRRFLPQVVRDVDELESAGALVLSPQRPRVTSWLDDFAFLEGDCSNIAHAVQARHLQAIERSSFVWLVCPDGYVGASAAFEISWAASHGVPVYSLLRPLDCAVAPYVIEVGSIGQAVTHARHRIPQYVPTVSPTILIDPEAGADLAVRAISAIRNRLCDRGSPRVASDPVVSASARRLRALLELL
jgi:hypothetical protein